MTQEKFEKTTDLGLAALTEAVSSAQDPTATIGVLLANAGVALVPGLGSALAVAAVRAYSRRLEAKLDRWLALVAALLELGTVEEAAKHVLANIDEPWANKGVVEGVRAVLGDIDDAVLPSLALLTARRIKGKVLFDPAAKRAIRLLCDCDHIVFKALVDVVQACHAAFPQADETVEGVLTGQQNGSYKFEVRVPHAAGVQVLGRIDAARHFFHVLHLLKTHEFATDTPSGSMDVAGGPHVMLIRRDQVAYLRSFVVIPTEGPFA